MQNYKQIFPEKLEPLIKDIEQHPPKIPGFRIAFLKQILYWICTKKDDTGYSYLNMKLLRKQIPQAEKYVKNLIENKLIERTKGYTPGERSYGYRIALHYDSRYTVKTVTDQRLIYRIKKTPRKFARGFNKQNTYIKNFTFDPAVMKFAESNYTGESLKSAIVSINMANNDEKYSLTDEAGGRFYSNLTNMPKELRQFVTVNGKRLTANVDISNSQPYFTTMILTNPAGLERFAKSREFAMVLKSLHVPDNDDINLYVKLVTNGQFYEYLMPNFKAKGLPCTRDAVKKAVMIILFDRNRTRVSRAKRIFRKLFPTVYEVFTIVRGDGGGERFPILLQTIEAYIVLKVILPRINTEHPEIVAFTVHDSLLVTDSPDIVKTVMIEELTKFTGFNPILKIENFRPPAPFSHSQRYKRRERGRREEKAGGCTIMVLEPL